jgi:hypothetical protein
VFNNFKTKAFINDNDIDNHKLLMDINDTEEAQFYFDESTCFKSAGLLKYLYSKDENIFIISIKELLMLFKGENISYRNFFNYYGLETTMILFSPQTIPKFKIVI